MNIYLNCGPVRSTFTLKLQYQDQSVCRTKLFFLLFFQQHVPDSFCPQIFIWFFCENLTALVKKSGLVWLECMKVHCRIFFIFQTFQTPLCIICIYVHHLPAPWLNSARPACPPLGGISTRTKLTARVGSQRIRGGEKLRREIREKWLR